jgi:hypothetical protein
MPDPSRPNPIWFIWPYLSTLERMFIMALIVLSIYVLFSALVALSHVWKTRTSRRNENSDGVEESFVGLRKRSARVHNLITAAFYLFGVVLFLGLQGAYVQLGDSNVPGGFLILRDFEPHFIFAAHVFFIFLALHVVGWFISYCAGRFPAQSRSQEA